MNFDNIKFFLMIGLAPTVEEFIFRGLFLGGFLKRYSPAKAIFWSSFMFGLFHLNPVQIPNAILIGLTLGWIYWLTGSLLPCIFLHFFINLTMAILIHYSESLLQSIKVIVANDPVYYFLSVFGVLIFIFSLWLIHKTIPKIPARQVK